LECDITFLLIPNEATIEFDEDGNYKITDLIGTQSLNDILIDLDYDIDEIHRKLKNIIENSNMNEDEKKYFRTTFSAFK